MRMAIRSLLETLGIPLADGMSVDLVLWGLLGLLLKLALSSSHPRHQERAMCKTDSAAPAANSPGSQAFCTRAVATRTRRRPEISVELPEPEPEPEPELELPEGLDRGLVYVTALPSKEQVVARMLLHLASDGSVRPIRDLLEDSMPRLDVLHPSSVGVAETVLHLLARRGNALAIMELLARGAPASARDSNGATALDVATAAGHTAAARALLTANGNARLLRKKQGMLRVPPAAGWCLDGTGWLGGTATVYESSAGVIFSWEPTKDLAGGPTAIAASAIASARPSSVFGVTNSQFEVHMVDKSVLRLMAESETARDHWVRWITLALAANDDAPSPCEVAPERTVAGSLSESSQHGGRPRGRFRASRRSSMFAAVACSSCSAKLSEASQKEIFDMKCQATASERVTQSLSQKDNGAEPNVLGRRNKLPVLCLPGFCSSGLEVKSSEYMPSWTNTRVWFSLPKLARARTQTSGTKGDCIAQSISVKVQRAYQLSLDPEKDREKIDGLVVKLCLLSKTGAKLAEGTTEPIRLTDGEVWSGVADYGQSVLLTSNSHISAASIHVSLIDEDTAEFDDDDCAVEHTEHFGATTLRLKDLTKGNMISHALQQGGKSAGFVTLEAGPLNRASKSEARAEESAMEEAQAKISRRGQQTDAARRSDEEEMDEDEDEDEGIPKAWMHHMLLGDDGHSDPAGIKVREVRGLKGCDYLQPDSLLMRTTTWVFGHVTKHLKGLGYGPHNLKAATYDWRLPPMFLEEQSAYFSRLIRTVEKMYKDAGNRPIVLLGHSMGCKMGHYFPNWVINNGAKQGLADPKAWLDKHIFSLYAVGGPFLGARGAVKAVLSGDHMGVGDFIGNKNTIRLSRSFGSGMWLYPEGPLRTAQPYGNVYVGDKGRVQIEIVSATFHNCTSLGRGSALSVKLTHAKTVCGKRRQTVSRTAFVNGTSIDGDGAHNNSSSADLRFNWLQKFQLVSEKLSLGDSKHEQLCFEVEQQDGLYCSTAAARQARNTLWNRNKTCWVGGIPDCVIADKSNSVLRGIFGEFGEIESITARPKAGTNNSWAFVVFMKKEQAELAVAVSKSRKIVIPEDRLEQASGAVDRELRVRMVNNDMMMKDEHSHRWMQINKSGRHKLGTIETDVNGLFIALRGGDSTGNLKRNSAVLAHPTLMKRLAIGFKEGKGLDIRDRQKQGKTFHNCFIAAEGVEWISQWLQDNHCDHGLSVSNRLFSELHRGNLFEVLEHDEVSGKSKIHVQQSFADAHIFCRMVRGGGSTIFGQDVDSRLPTSPASPASVRLISQMSEKWKSTSAATMAALRLQGAFRARRALRAAQRYTKVMTRTLVIFAPDAEGRAGKAIGELVLRCVWNQTDPEKLVTLAKNEKFEDKGDGLQVLHDNGGSKQVDWHRRYYQTDPNYLLNDTVFKAPPLQRLMHVYGTSLDTPWSFVYRSRDGVELKEQGPCSLGLELDPNASDLGDRNYVLQGGELYETKHTLQRLPDDPDVNVRTSGDGTVPYQSLRFSQTWDSPHFLSQCIELTGKEHEHREILSSKQFHRILTEYLTDTVIIYIIEARDLPAMDASGTSDPYCDVFAVDSSNKVSERWKTTVINKTLQPTFNERFAFGVDSDLCEIQRIVIDIYDSDPLSQDDLMGTIKIDLQEIVKAPRQAIHGWCPLRDKTGRAGLGALHIHAELESAGQSSLAIKDHMAVAAGCKNLTDSRGGQRAAATTLWQFEDQHSQLWSSVNLFHGLNAAQKSAIKMALVKRRFRPGDVIVKQGDPSDSMYIIEDGVCEVSAKVKDSLTGEYAHRTLPTLVRGEHFGEMALLPVGGENGTPRARTATVFAITTVECLSLSREVFLDVTTEGAAFYQSSNAMVASGLLVDKG